MDDALDDRIDDDELTALALAADPDQPLASHAVPIRIAGSTPGGLLPAWYMPAPLAGGRGRARRAVLGGLVLALVVITGAGLCVTDGLPEVAW